MKTQLLAIIIAAGVSGCATVPQAPQVSFSQTCVNMGFKRGTEPFLGCLQLVSNHAAQSEATEQQDRAARMQAVGGYILNNRPQPMPMPIMPFQFPQRGGVQVWIPSRY